MANRRSRSTPSLVRQPSVRLLPRTVSTATLLLPPQSPVHPRRPDRCPPPLPRRSRTALAFECGSTRSSRICVHISVHSATVSSARARKKAFSTTHSATHCVSLRSRTIAHCSLRKVHVHRSCRQMLSAFHCDRLMRFVSKTAKSATDSQIEAFVPHHHGNVFVVLIFLNRSN